MSPKLTVRVAEEWIGRTVPVRIGVPWPSGMFFQSSAVRVLTSAGEPCQTQVRTLEYWPDGSSKWVLFDFLLRARHASDVLTMEVGNSFAGNGPEPPAEAGQQRFICESAVTGDRHFLSLRSTDEADQRPFELTMQLADEKGRDWQAVVRNIEPVDRGPVRHSTCTTAEFERDGKKYPLELRVTHDWCASLGCLVVEVDLLNPQAALHPGNVWDLGDAGSIAFSDLTATLKSTTKASVSHCFVNPGEAVRVPTADWTVHQDSSGGDRWDSQNHVDANGDLTVSFSGFALRDESTGEIIHTGRRAQPVVAAEFGALSTAVSLDRFWENFPSALRMSGNAIDAALFPSESKGSFELQGGERKRQRIMIAISDDADAAALAATVNAAAEVWIDPEWIAQTRVIPWFSAPQEHEGSNSYELYLESIVDGDKSFKNRREVIDEYGWRHFGDLYADHEAVHEEVPGSTISHYNNQYDFVFGAAINALRKQDLRWWELMESAARHHIDIDVYHTRDDRAAYNRGLFWHTEHYKSAGTATHRTYSRINRRNKGFGGGPSNEHNYTSGLTLYHCLTGDPLAKEVVVGLAEWVIGMDDGTTTLWSVIDPVTPTGFASRTKDDGFHGPGRGAGNSINALLDAHALTGDRKFIEFTEVLIKRCIHPHDDVAKNDLDEPEYRWSYLVFLQALGKYLWVKENAEELDYYFYYARDSLLHYARWMVEHERPYSELYHKVDLPTETWSAQDIRKAHVLFLAGAYAPQHEIDAFREKAEMYYQRCLDDLLAFGTAYLCRPRVILAVHGHIRPFFSAESSGAIAIARVPERGYQYGQPTDFVPQRANLGNALRERVARVIGELSRFLPASVRRLGRLPVSRGNPR